MKGGRVASDSRREQFLSRGRVAHEHAVHGAKRIVFVSGCGLEGLFVGLEGSAQWCSYSSNAIMVSVVSRRGVAKQEGQAERSTYR
jgi:hypothetical protein